MERFTLSSVGLHLRFESLLQRMFPSATLSATHSNSAISGTRTPSQNATTVSTYLSWRDCPFAGARRILRRTSVSNAVSNADESR